MNVPNHELDRAQQINDDNISAGYYQKKLLPRCRSIAGYITDRCEQEGLKDCDKRARGAVIDFARQAAGGIDDTVIAKRILPDLGMDPSVFDSPEVIEATYVIDGVRHNPHGIGLRTRIAHIFKTTRT